MAKARKSEERKGSVGEMQLSTLDALLLEPSTPLSLAGALNVPSTGVVYQLLRIHYSKEAVLVVSCWSLILLHLSIDVAGSDSGSYAVCSMT